MTLQYEMTYYWPISLSSEVNRIIYNNQYRNVCEKKGRLDHVRFQNDLSLSNKTIFHIFVMILIWFLCFQFIYMEIIKFGNHTHIIRVLFRRNVDSKSWWKWTSFYRKYLFTTGVLLYCFLLHYRLHRFVVQNDPYEKTFENVIVI